MDSNNADNESRVARLAERVDNQGFRITNLEAVVTKGFSDIQSQFGRQFNELSVELRNKDRTPWGVIWSAMGVCAAILFGIGGALYMPVKVTMEETKADLRALRNDALSVAAFQDFRATYENNRVVSRNEYIDKFGQMASSIKEVRDAQVPRKELERTWQLFDQSIAFLQTQVNDLKRDSASVYTPRDKLLEQENEIQKLRDLIRNMQMQQRPIQ